MKFETELIVTDMVEDGGNDVVGDDEVKVELKVDVELAVTDVDDEASVVAKEVVLVELEGFVKLAVTRAEDESVVVVEVLVKSKEVVKLKAVDVVDDSGTVTVEVIVEL